MISTNLILISERELHILWFLSLCFRDGLTEENVKRYLLRKPMSPKDLARVFKSKKLPMSKEEIVLKIAEILKKLKTTQQKINGVVHFSISE